MLWLKFRNLAVIVNCVTRSLNHWNALNVSVSVVIVVIVVIVVTVVTVVFVCIVVIVVIIVAIVVWNQKSVTHSLNQWSVTRSSIELSWTANINFDIRVCHQDSKTFPSFFSFLFSTFFFSEKNLCSKSWWDYLLSTFSLSWVFVLPINWISQQSILGCRALHRCAERNLFFPHHQDKQGSFSSLS